MQSNLRGELTTGNGPKMEEYDLIDAVARSMHVTVSSPKEWCQMYSTLFPSMLNAAVKANDIQKVRCLKYFPTQTHFNYFEILDKQFERLWC